MKGYMLEAQLLVIGRLTAEDNRIKGLVEGPKPSDINFEEGLKRCRRGDTGAAILSS